MNMISGLVKKVDADLITNHSVAMIQYEFVQLLNGGEQLNEFVRKICSMAVRDEDFHVKLLLGLIYFITLGRLRINWFIIRHSQSIQFLINVEIFQQATA